MLQNAVDAGLSMAGFTPTTYGVLGILAVVTMALIRVSPLIKAKKNDLRKIELDGQADLRGDLLERIKTLEADRDASHIRFDAALAAERLRCEAEMASLRLEMEKRIQDLTNIISQNSKSTAQMIGRPGEAPMASPPRD